MRILGLFLAIVTVFAASAHAQESVGRAVVEGKVIILYSDGTWEFEAVDTDCSVVAKDITFCSNSDGWEKVSNASADAAASFRLDDRNYGMVIDEALGIEDGMDKEFMTGAVIYNVAVGAGITESEVVTMDIDDGTLFGRDARTIIYGAAVDGLDVIYVNSILFSKNRTIQMVSYSVGRELTDQQIETHQSFVSTIDIK